MVVRLVGTHRAQPMISAGDGTTTGTVDVAPILLPLNLMIKRAHRMPPRRRQHQGPRMKVPGGRPTLTSQYRLVERNIRALEAQIVEGGSHAELTKAVNELTLLSDRKLAILQEIAKRTATHSKTAGAQCDTASGMSATAIRLRDSSRERRLASVRRDIAARGNGRRLRLGGGEFCVVHPLIGLVCVLGYVAASPFWLGYHLMRLTAAGLEALRRLPDGGVAVAEDGLSVGAAHKAFADYWAAARARPKPLLIKNESPTDLCVRLYYGRDDKPEPALTASWLSLPHFLEISKNWAEADFIAYAGRISELVVPPNFDGGLLLPAGKSIVVLEPPYRFRYKRQVIGARPLPLSGGAFPRFRLPGFHSATVAGALGPTPPPLPPRPFPSPGPPPPRPPRPQARRKFAPLPPSPEGGLDALPANLYARDEILLRPETPPVKLAGSAHLANIVILS